MQGRRLISFGLLFVVLIAPALSLAICSTAVPVIKPTCSHCTAKKHNLGFNTELRNGQTEQGSRPSQKPVAPCCQRQTPAQSVAESAALVVAPIQIALMPSASAVATQSVKAQFLVETLASPPSPDIALSVLCTFLI